MKDSIRHKLERLAARHEEVGVLLSQPSAAADSNRFRELSQEYARLEPLAQKFQAFTQAEADLGAADEMGEDPDSGIRALAEDERRGARARLEALEPELMKLLLPRDPHDDSNIFLEIRAGTGGDEAAIFAGDLFRMYGRYAEEQGWKVEILSESSGEHGGYKEIITRVVGQGAYSRFKFESGTHRVQRVPETESQGRIHT
ncbi:MAG TPA: PCRF domain-containing protein, partial [Gammaproteobacteria bacterium]